MEPKIGDRFSQGVRVTMHVADYSALRSEKLRRTESRKWFDTYARAASHFARWRKVFLDTRWEHPGWSSGMDSFKRYTSRGAYIEVVREQALPNIDDASNEDRICLAIFRDAHDLDYTTITVGKSVINASLLTDIPESWDLKQVPLPYPVTVFVLPKGFTIQGSRLDTLIVLTHKSSHSDQLVVVGLQDAWPVLMSVNTITDGVWYANPDTGVLQVLPVFGLIINLIGIMHARPQWVEPGESLRVVPRKSGGSLEVRQPCIFGRKTPGHDFESSGGSGKSPAGHWRRGHFHTVLYGPGKTLRRVDWFEPVMVLGGLTGLKTNEKSL